MIARTLHRTVRRRAGDESGSYLIEVVISALILVIVALGVLKSLDRGTLLGGEQKVQAVAGNVAHAELEQIRALPIAEQSNMRRVSTHAVGGVTYTTTSRADWVDDASADAGCSKASSKADYMKLSTTVTWPAMGSRKAVKLESLVAPGVRAFAADQGSLAVHITDRKGDGVGGLPLSLTGGATLTDLTNSAGCVLWGYLTAGTGYTLGFSRTPDYVLTDGTQIASMPVAVVGGQTSNVAVQYDRGGRLRTAFKTKRPGSDPPDKLISTSPQKAHVTHAGGGGVSIGYDVTGDEATSPLLFPFTSGYTIHPDSCRAAEVPVPPPAPYPLTPGAPDAVAAVVTPGITTTTPIVQLPGLNIVVRRDGVPVANAVIRVTTTCGTVYRRTTTANGAIDDPGFPYAKSLDICVSDGRRQRKTTSVNNNFNASNLLIKLVSTDAEGNCS